MFQRALNATKIASKPFFISKKGGVWYTGNTESRKKEANVSRMRKTIILICALLFLMGMSSASAQGRLYVFDSGHPPDELAETADAVAVGESTITMTFAGDCTLGGETAIQSSRHSFRSIVEKNGTAYPFANVQSLFANDDLTMVNLEGVLSASTEDKVKKKYNYIGDPSYVDVLTDGSVECVNLANNHIMDYSERGYRDTAAALDSAGIGYVYEDTLCIFEKDGVRIGLTATLWQADEEKLREQVQLLHSLGCSAIVHTMHAGEEYERVHMASQERIAKAAVNAGASLVVGHHPHVVQDIDVIGGVPIIYSLGNCCFGGNTNPKDYHALLLSVSFRFVDGGLKELLWTLHPITQSTERGRNNFQPTMLTGTEAESVIEEIQSISSVEILPYQEGLGARQKSILWD